MSATAAASPNFAYLAHHDPKLAMLGARAEALFASDPAATLAVLRVFGELLAKRAAANVGLMLGHQEEQLSLVDRLHERGAMNAQTKAIFHGLRMAGNDAAHEWSGTHQAALHQRRMALGSPLIPTPSASTKA